ncbi:MAG: hypothetical protein ACP5FZ_09840 [Fidelibacterota bacterium]
MRITTFIICVMAVVLTMVLSDCVSKEPLPTFYESEQADTSYIQVMPNWEQSVYGFNAIKDILIGEDSYLFIADSGNNRIIVLDRAGNLVESDDYGNDFSGLASLEVPGVSAIEPLRLTQDSKMNLIIADGSNRLYAWNQFFNNVGVDSVATELLLFNSQTNDTHRLTQIDSLLFYSNSGYAVLDVQFERNEERIAEVLGVHIFYDGYDIKNILKDEYGDPRNSRIVDVAAFGQDYDAGLYLMDYRYNRIIKGYYYIRDVLRLSDQSIVFAYGCRFSEVVTGQGSGAGYVMEPNSISLDASGNIYYTQTGGNFLCHGLAGGSYRTLFDPGADEIMNTSRFGIPRDICIDSRSVIYVADAGLNYIHSFSGTGAFIRNIGTEPVDSVEVGYILDRPEALVFEDNILYVADTGNARIVRFQYVVLAEQNVSRGND